MKEECGRGNPTCLGELWRCKALGSNKTELSIMPRPLTVSRLDFNSIQNSQQSKSAGPCSSIIFLVPIAIQNPQIPTFGSFLFSIPLLTSPQISITSLTPHFFFSSSHQAWFVDSD